MEERNPGEQSPVPPKRFVPQRPQGSQSSGRYVPLYLRRVSPPRSSSNQWVEGHPGGYRSQGGLTRGTSVIHRQQHCYYMDRFGRLQEQHAYWEYQEERRHFNAPVYRPHQVPLRGRGRPWSRPMNGYPRHRSSTPERWREDSPREEVQPERVRQEPPRLEEFPPLPECGGQPRNEDPLYNYDSPQVPSRETATPMGGDVQPVHLSDDFASEASSPASPAPPHPSEDEIMGIVRGSHDEEELLERFNQSLVAQLDRVPPSASTPTEPPETPPPAFLQPPVEVPVPNPLPYPTGARFTIPLDELKLPQLLDSTLFQSQPGNHQKAAYSGEAGLSLAEKARQRLHEFQKDFPEDKPCQAVVGPSSSRAVQLDVEDTTFVDPRPVVNLVQEGEAEFNFFDEERRDPAYDVLTEVYNVNDIGFTDSIELVGSKVQPHTMRKWPLDVLGSNGETLRNHVLNLGKGLYSRCPPLRRENKKAKSDSLGIYGLGALVDALAFCQANAKDLPLSAVLVVGVNPHKLVKGLSLDRPLTSRFAGPLSDRNAVATVEVLQGFPEYDLPSGRDEMENDLSVYEWKVKHRLTRDKFKRLPMDTLLFIFYMLTNDALQVVAAQELYFRGWRYHKIHQVWMVPLDERPSQGSDENPWRTGIYQYFHYGKWTYCVGRCEITKGMIEGKPMEVEEPLWM